jgi:signal transduction histidine kinase
MDGSIAGEVMDSGKPRLITDYGVTPGSLPLDAAIGPVAVIPLTVGEDIRGVVHLGRLRDHPALTSFDVDMAASFATQASITLELIDARSDQMNLARLEDHDRIARDLHDHVIQELFAVGMSIQSLVGVVSNEAHAERLTKQVDSLDRAIARIRASIFELRHDQDRPHGIAIRLENVIGEHQSQLGFAPTYELVGLERSDDLEPLADDLEAVLREGLSNCARHAAATSARIVVARQGEVVLVEIADNGDGIRKTDRLSGLQNLRDRAERHGGSMTLSRAEGGGTHLVWTAHLS